MSRVNGPLGRLRAPDGTVVAVFAGLRTRAEQMRAGSPISARLAGSARVDQLAAYALSKGDDAPVTAILKLAVRGPRYRPGPLAKSVVERLGSAWGDPPSVTDSFEQLLAATAIDAVDAMAQQAQQDATRAATRPGQMETHVFEKVGALYEELKQARQLDMPEPGPARPVVHTDTLLDKAAHDSDNAVLAQADAATVAQAAVDDDARIFKVFGASRERVRTMFPQLDDDEFEALLTQRAGPRELPEAPAAPAPVERPAKLEGVRKRGSGWQAFWRERGKQKQQGGFPTAEDAFAYRQEQLAVKGD